jgi:hypothetical protein
LRLALITLVQFMEGLSDRQAADAVRTRIDWKYLLCLELTDRAFDHTVLSEFRTRLLVHGAERRRFDAILTRATEHGWVKAGGRQRSDSTHVLGAMHLLGRIEVVAETLRHTLNVLATRAPDWLQAHTGPAGAERYADRPSEYRLPKGEAKRIAWADQIGADGMALLMALFDVSAPPELRALPAVEILRQVWVQNFMVQEERTVWRDNDNTPPSGRYIGSPYDPETRYATKRETRWTGYKVHLTETCDEQRPNLITNVETTSAAVADDAVTEHIRERLAQRQLVPDKHIADTGFVNSALFVSSRDTYGIDLIGPTRSDNHWQAQAGAGFAARDFVIDWEQQTVTCPQGNSSSSWTAAVGKFKNHVIKIKFGKRACRECSVSAQCTRTLPPRRTITIRPQAQHEALLAGRQREQTAAYAVEYARRAGVEGTIAQGVRSHEMRRWRYCGQPKTHLQHLMTAAAINVVRILRWLAGEPKATTQVSAFARLYQPVT